MEDIVPLEIRLAYPKKDVFVLQFPAGEFVIIIFDPAVASFQIFKAAFSSSPFPGRRYPGQQAQI
ncbi:MAG TPA: hypothetical protein H9744_10800 [Candidatus Eisenbergiella stercoravium]|nr:hypothetical protein [Candidatus Eisenbergiella stercoravium]